MWENDTYSHKGWLQSDYFWKRALGVFGYQLAIAAVIYAIIFGVLIAVVLVG
jgi:hypothetical protein